VDAFTSAGKTDAELKGRASLLRIFRFLKTQPGFEQLSIAWSAPECGIRETRRIRGRSSVDVDSYMNGRHWPDAVCYSFYPIDLHTDEGLKKVMLDEGIVPTLPLTCMLPAGVDGILAAGRCAAGDQLANSAYRIQASCMAMGQAAGAAAALAAARGILNLDQLDVSELQAPLTDNGAIFPMLQENVTTDSLAESK
jgi:hypothetical protein